MERVSECFLLTGGQGEGKEGVWGTRGGGNEGEFCHRQQSLGHLKCRVELLSWFSGEIDPVICLPRSVWVEGHLLEELASTLFKRMDCEWCNFRDKQDYFS